MYLGKLGELTLKGSNVKVFEKQLLTNVKYALSGLPAKMWLSSGRLYIACKEECCSAVEYALDHLIGITGWAKVRCVEKTIDAIKAAVREEGLAAKASGAKTFKIDARREDKAFELNSYEIAIQAAGVLFDDNTLV